MRYAILLFGLMLVLAAADATRRVPTAPVPAPAPRPQPGFVPLPPPPPPAQPPPYRGLRVEADPGRPAPWALQLRVEDALNAARPEPATRAAQFRWLEEAHFRIVGYRGVVADATATPTGWRAKILVTPTLDGASTVFEDTAEEVYEMVGGELHFVSGRRQPGSGPTLISD